MVTESTKKYKGIYPTATYGKGANDNDNNLKNIKIK
jgi:hypothetical protein